MMYKKQGIGKKEILKRWAKGKKLTGHIKSYRIKRKGIKHILYVK